MRNSPRDPSCHLPELGRRCRYSRATSSPTTGFCTEEAGPGPALHFSHSSADPFHVGGPTNPPLTPRPTVLSRGISTHLLRVGGLGACPPSELLTKGVGRGVQGPNGWSPRLALSPQDQAHPTLPRSQHVLWARTLQRLGSDARSRLGSPQTRTAPSL